MAFARNLNFLWGQGVKISPLLFRLAVYWQFLVYIFIFSSLRLFVKSRISLALVVNPAIFLFTSIEVRSRIWRKTLNVWDTHANVSNFQRHSSAPLCFNFPVRLLFSISNGAAREELTVMIMFYISNKFHGYIYQVLNLFSG